jgi:hypothetical protein
LQASVACLVTSIAPVALQLLTGSPLAAEHPEGVPAAQIFASYQDAMNRHDADAVAAYWVRDGEFVFDARTAETIMELVREWSAQETRK